MKKLSAILLGLILALNSFAQIPNSGFENWTSMGIYDNPYGWNTSNPGFNGTNYSCTKSTDHYPADSGSFSVRLESFFGVPSAEGGWGMMLTGGNDLPPKPSFPLIGHPRYVRGYFKYFPQNNDTMMMMFMLFKDGKHIKNKENKDNIFATATPEWTPFIIPLTPGDTADSAKMMIFSFSTDQSLRDPKGNSVLYVDNLSYGYNCPDVDTSIITNKNPGWKCEGDSVELEGNTLAGCTYQWYRNGSPIAGATKQQQKCYTSGVYMLEVMKNGCGDFSDPIKLQFGADKPYIKVQSGTILPCVGGKLVLTTTKAYDAYKWSNDTAKQTTTVSKSGWYTVTVTDDNGCKATSDPFVLNASKVAAPSICAVTVNPTTNKNVIFWDRPVSEEILKYKIYKEGTELNKFELLATIDYTDYNSYVDEASNALIESNRYAITIIDSCDIESALSPIHKTMHLTLNERVGGGINLIWENYEGLTIPGYVIYHGMSKDKMEVFTEISSSKTTYSIINQLKPYYQIGIKLPKDCSASQLKAESGPYAQSLSNIVEYKSSAFEENKQQISIFPNPCHDVVTIKRSTTPPIRVKVLDVSGLVLIDQVLIGEDINVEALPSGIYILQAEDSFFKLIKW